jgi:hypothetical protein
MVCDVAFDMAIYIFYKIEESSFLADLSELTLGIFEFSDDSCSRARGAKRNIALGVSGIRFLALGFYTLFWKTGGIRRLSSLNCRRNTSLKARILKFCSKPRKPRTW